MSDPNVLVILASIGPTEVYHFAIFQEALEGIAGLEVVGGQRSQIFAIVPTGDK